MKTYQVHNEEMGQRKGLIVVIDVLRAFTTTAYAFSRGVKEIYLVNSLDEAFELHRKNPAFLLVGEKNGRVVEGFHYSNSPHRISQEKLDGATLVMRTSNGTKGVGLTEPHEQVLTASFVNAEATIERIKQLSPKEVTFVTTGVNPSRGGAWGEEDVCLAEYITAKLQDAPANPDHFLDRASKSNAAHVLRGDTFPEIPVEDVELSLHVDLFPFAMEVFTENGHAILKPVSVSTAVLA